MQSDVPIDLETICLKCLNKEAHNRYATATELAEDLRCYLDGRPISARPVSFGVRIARWAKRRPATTATIVGVTLLLLTVTVGSLIAASNFRKLAAEKSQESLAASNATRLAEQREKEANLARAIVERQKRKAEELARDSREKLYSSEMIAACIASEEHHHMGPIVRALKPWNSNSGDDLRGWEWYFLNALSQGGDLRLKLSEVPQWSLWIGWSADESSIGVTQNQTLVIYDSTTGKRERSFPKRDAQQFAVLSAAWSPDRLLLAGAQRYGPIQIWNWETARITRTLPGEWGGQTYLDWSSDGKYLVAIDETSKTVVWDAQNYELLDSFQSNHVHRVYLHPFLPWIGRTTQEGFDLYDFINKKKVHSWNDKAIIQGRVSPDGEKIALTVYQEDTSHVVDVYSLPEKELIGRWTGSSAAIRHLDWNPHSGSLAIVGDDGAARVVSVPDLYTTHQFRGHIDRINYAAWSKDGQRLLTTGSDTDAHLWSLDSVGPRQSVSVQLPVAFEFDNNNDNPLVITSGQLARWNPSESEPRLYKEINKLFPSQIVSIATNPHTSEVAALCRDRSVHLVTAEQLVSAQPESIQCLCEGSEKNPIPDRHIGPRLIAWDRSGRYLAAVNESNCVEVRDMKSEQTWKTPPSTSLVMSLEFSLDGSRLLYATGDALMVWRRAGETATCERLLSGFVTTAIWSHDGKSILAGDNSGPVLYDSESGAKQRQFIGTQYNLMDVDWSPDNKRIAAIDWKGVVIIWDTRTGHVVARFRARNRRPDGVSIHWSADSKKLFVATFKSIELFDASRGY